MLEFLRACLEPNPAKRATASQLLRTAYMREGAWETQVMMVVWSIIRACAFEEVLAG
jgi:hypothetical protein